MAMAAVYTTINGMLVHESRGGVESFYFPDTLGNLTTVRSATGVKTYGAEYCPYGEIQTETGTNPSPWSFVGLLGYLRDTASRLYVRARHYRPGLARWQTVDPLWPEESAYAYAHSPVTNVDSSGLAPVFQDPPGDMKEYIQHVLELSCIDDIVNAPGGAFDVGRRFCSSIRKPGDLTCLNEGPGGALRHCYASCLAYRECDKDYVCSALKNHEAPYMNSAPGTYSYFDTCMDLHNNEMGRKFSTQKGTCLEQCTRALKNGRLGLIQGMGYKKAKINCYHWMPRRGPGQHWL